MDLACAAGDIGACRRRCLVGDLDRDFAGDRGHFVADAKREIDQISLEVSDEKTSLLRLTANAKSHSDPDALAKEFLALKDMKKLKPSHNGR